MAGVHQAFEAFGTAVTLLDGKREDPVVAPVAAAGELGHRHDLHGGDAQLFEAGQMGNDGSEGASRREGAHVEFIDDKIFEGQTEPDWSSQAKGGSTTWEGPCTSWGCCREAGSGKSSRSLSR